LIGAKDDMQLKENNLIAAHKILRDTKSLLGGKLESWRPRRGHMTCVTCARAPQLATPTVQVLVN